MKLLILLAIIYCLTIVKASTEVESPEVSTWKIMSSYFNMRAYIDLGLGWFFYYIFCKYYVAKQFTSYSSAIAKEECMAHVKEEIFKNWTT